MVLSFGYLVLRQVLQLVVSPASARSVTGAGN